MNSYISAIKIGKRFGPQKKPSCRKCSKLKEQKIKANPLPILVQNGFIEAVLASSHI